MAIALSGSSDGNNIPPGTSSSTTSSSEPTASKVAPATTAAAATTNITTTRSPENNNNNNTNNNNSSSKKGINEMVGGCAVCSDENGSEENPLVYCDGCELAVHQACYGIDKIPPGNWFCSKCASGNSHNNVKCELCPTRDGALKKTETGLWAHVICALYIPEVRFSNNNTMEPIEIKHIGKDRYSKACYICEERGNSAAAIYGAKTNCQKMGCKQSFHATCAQAHGLLREEYKPGSDVISYCGYCKHHFRKLKADNNNHNRRQGNTSSNPSSSSVLDSASDSSQDNDSHRNTTTSEQQDKSNPNRTKVLPTNWSSSAETTTPANNIQQQQQSSSASSHSLTANKSAAQQANNASISLTVTANSIGATGSTSKTTIATTSAMDGQNSSTATPQKKKRASKSGQGQNSSNEQQQPSGNSSTLLATIGSSFSTQSSSVGATASGGSTIEPTNSDGHDVYDWPSGNKDAEKNSSCSKTNRKKPSSSSTNAQSLSSKSVLLTNQQQQVASNYNASKIGSPNLSISTSPSLASPSSSTKSTSNSSTSSTSTATASSSSSSSSSTTSSSPSPALLSPSISNRGSAVRLESPLASNSKTSSIGPINKLPMESLATNSTAPALNPIISTRINLDNPRADLRKGLTVSSSLLSTAVPMLNHNPTITETSATSGAGSAGATCNLPPKSGPPNAIDGPVKDKIPTTSTTSKPDTAQPTIPPLIIPVPQGSVTSSPTKPAAKTRAPARNTKRKATENTAITKPEPELKAKLSRSKKAAGGSVAEIDAVAAQKPEPKRRKAKANAKATVGTSSAPSSSSNLADASSKLASNPSPSKRKSRTASAESNPAPAPNPAPSPAKRIRKKKTDPPAPPANESSKSTSSQPALNLPINPQSSMHNPMGISPLMINTPALTNPVGPGFNSVDGLNAGTRYYSPMVSPYNNYDQMAASSLGRQSLARVFTSSSVNANSPDDPTKAFEELRDNTWSHVSKCVLDQAQQFDIPSLIGTLYHLRAENEKLTNKVRDLHMRREQLNTANARLDMPGPMLTQHLTSTSPSFSSLVSGLTNSPKSLPTPSPGSALGKQPLMTANSLYNHMGPGPLGPPNFLDRSSPLVGGQAHSTLNNIKSSSISTPSPPIGALMAHSNNNRAGLIQANPPYMPNSYPQMNATGHINSTPQGSSFYTRQ